MDLCTGITQGILRGCRDNAGGVYEFYIATKPADSYTTIDTDGLIEGIFTTPAMAAGDEVLFYKFVPNKNSSEFTETPTVSDESGTVGFEQKVMMTFAKMEQAKAQQVYKMAFKDALIVVKDKNKNFFLLGENDGMALSGGNSGSGKGLTDLNGYALELTANEGTFATQVLSSSLDVDTVGTTPEETSYIFTNI